MSEQFAYIDPVAEFTARMTVSRPKLSPAQQKQQDARTTREQVVDIMENLTPGANGELCVSQGDYFFSEENDLPEEAKQKERVARALCQSCPVIASCLEAALDTEDTQGIWGGTNEKERRRIRRRRLIL